MREEKPLTRKEMGEKYPEYYSLDAIDRIELNLQENTQAGNYLRNFAPNLEIILAGTMVVGTLVLNVISPEFRNEYPPNEQWIRYCLAAVIGGTLGYGIRISFGTLAYETFSEEGEIREMFDYIKSSLSDRF